MGVARFGGFITRGWVNAAVAAGVLASVLLVAAPAEAISRGTPDGNGHPMVAALGITTPEGVLQGCGGALVSETVLVTAAHCVAPGAIPLGSELRVTFANEAAPGAPVWFAPVGVAADPDFVKSNGQSADVGVVLLAPGQAAGRPFAQLPTRGQLDAMATAKTLASTTFDLVGYGCRADASRGGPHRIECPTPERVAATAPFQTLRPSWLVLNINVNATGEGGQCYHDSGSPEFLHGSTRIVSVTHAGDAVCRASNTNARLDTDTARAFLSGFIQVP